MYKQILDNYFKAWNEHDIDSIMAFMTDDCVFETGGGSQPFGTRYIGKEKVKLRFMEVWKDFPNIRFENIEHIIQGNNACSRWRFIATDLNGVGIDIEGCDIFIIKHKRIFKKSSFIKNIR